VNISPFRFKSIIIVFVEKPYIYIRVYICITMLYNIILRTYTREYVLHSENPYDSYRFLTSTYAHTGRTTIPLNLSQVRPSYQYVRTQCAESSIRDFYARLRQVSRRMCRRLVRAFDFLFHPRAFTTHTHYTARYVIIVHLTDVYTIVSYSFSISFPFRPYYLIYYGIIIITIFTETAIYIRTVFVFVIADLRLAAEISNKCKLLIFEQPSIYFSSDYLMEPIYLIVFDIATINRFIIDFCTVKLNRSQL